jgi:hypothetical protein
VRPVVWAKDIITIGVDAEPDDALPEGVIHAVSTSGEQTRLREGWLPRRLLTASRAVPLMAVKITPIPGRASCLGRMIILTWNSPGTVL